MKQEIMHARIPNWWGLVFWWVEVHINNRYLKGGKWQEEEMERGREKTDTEGGGR